MAGKGLVLSNRRHQLRRVDSDACLAGRGTANGAWGQAQGVQAPGGCCSSSTGAGGQPRRLEAGASTAVRPTGIAWESSDSSSTCARLGVILPGLVRVTGMQFALASGAAKIVAAFSFWSARSAGKLATACSFAGASTKAKGEGVRHSALSLGVRQSALRLRGATRPVLNNTQAPVPVIVTVKALHSSSTSGRPALMQTTTASHPPTADQLPKPGQCTFGQTNKAGGSEGERLKRVPV